MGKLAKFFIILFCLVIIAISTGYMAFWYYFEYKTDDLPDVLSLNNYKFNLATIVRGDNGEVIEKFAVEDRTFIPYNSVPEVIVKAVTAAEDKNFWTKRLIPGIDILGILRALRDDVMAGKTVAGGSTITQQTAKLIWLSNERSLSRKFKEARIAYRMEKYLLKEKIFEIYINLVYFGHGKYGLVAASEFYFGKKPSELDTGEAAMIAGLIKWPYQFSPLNNQKIALNRRNVILERMLKNRFISAEEFFRLKAKSPLILNVKNSDHKAPYLSSFLMDELHRLGYEKVVNQGLEISTSLNSDFQRIADEALHNGIAAYEKRHEKRLVLYNISDYELTQEDFKSDSWDGDLGIGSIVDGLITHVFKDYAAAKIDDETVVISKDSINKIRKDVDDLIKIFKPGDIVSLKIIGVGAGGTFNVEVVQPEIQGAVVVLDVETGGIKAIVGGRDFKISKYNRAMQAERQAGSAFKPFVYGAFFEKYPDKDLDSIVLDSPICFKTGNPAKPKWCPKNYEEKSLPPFMGPIPIKTAIARSRNVAAIRVASITSIENVVDLANAAGITNELPKYLPTAIGAADVKLVDMASAYAMFFRHGVAKPYWFVDSIKNNNGQIRKLDVEDKKQVLSTEAADKVLEGMRWVALAGTARLASKELPFAVAGKTGTTNNFTDAWFIGGTPKYIVAVWIGFDRKAIPLVSRESSFKETGGSAALPVFIEIMKGIYKDRPYDVFPEEMENRIKGIKEEKNGEEKKE